MNGIRINIFRFSSNRKIIPWRISTLDYPETAHILELIGKKKRHFVFINNLGPLCSNYADSSHRTIYVCERCCHVMRDKDKYDSHVEMCKAHQIQRTSCPYGNGAKLSYTKSGEGVTRFESAEPFVAFADFECALEPTDNDPTILNTHRPISAVYKIVSPIDENFYSPPKTFVGYNCVVDFLDSLKADAEHLSNILSKPAPMAPSSAESDDLDTQTACHLCQQEFKSSDTVVLDHDHLTGILRGMHSILKN